MDVIYVSVLRQMMGFSTRWQLTIGEIAVFLLIYQFLCTTPGRVVTNADYPLLEKIADSAIKDRQKFERLLVPKEKLLEMFHVS
jgi:threonyl-tRNA synthetase